jgi:hypothetical protein
LTSEPIVSICVDVVAPDGDISRCDIAIYAPERQSTGEFGCVLVIPNEKTPITIYGIDSLQSLALAIRFLSSQLREQFEKGFRFYDPDFDKRTGDGIAFDSYFLDRYWPNPKNSFGDS